MPVKPLDSMILKWPDARAVDAAARLWARAAALQDRRIVKVGYYGSYAKGDWGVGSDLDLIMIVRSSDEPFERRSVRWDTTRLPVPAELHVYTEKEWDALHGSKFHDTVMCEAVWLGEELPEQGTCRR